ncbi:hypothetical protein TWF481_002848 [Arthrobotrys musiformis]|uniref:Uncharacterized protein n=1 Tax=Arthrobotrys musiformis TaxID=47236 RepID=A0AAV9VUB1_9PEZI
MCIPFIHTLKQFCGAIADGAQALRLQMRRKTQTHASAERCFTSCDAAAAGGARRELYTKVHPAPTFGSETSIISLHKAHSLPSRDCALETNFQQPQKAETIPTPTVSGSSALDPRSIIVSESETPPHRPSPGFEAISPQPRSLDKGQRSD